MDRTNIHFKNWEITVKSGIQILQARHKVRELSEKLAFTHADQVLVSSVVSESCRILLDHFSDFKISIKNRDGLYIKIYMLKKDQIKHLSPVPYPIDILSILNLELLTSQKFFDEVFSVRENGSAPYLILKKWN